MQLTIVDICGNAVNKRSNTREEYIFPLIELVGLYKAEDGV